MQCRTLGSLILVSQFFPGSLGSQSRVLLSSGFCGMPAFYGKILYMCNISWFLDPRMGVKLSAYGEAELLAQQK